MSTRRRRTSRLKQGRSKSSPTKARKHPFSPTRIYPDPFGIFENSSLHSMIQNIRANLLGPLFSGSPKKNSKSDVLIKEEKRKTSPHSFALRALLKAFLED